MTTDEIEKYIDSSKEVKNETNNESNNETNNETKTETLKEGPNNAGLKEDNSAEVAPSKDSQSASDERVEKKNKLSQQDRIDYAFAKEKSKRRAMKMEYEKRISELEKALNVSKKTKEDFDGDVDKYIDYRLSVNDSRNELNTLRNKLRENEMSDIDAENERRINNSFKTDAEKDEYRALLSERGQMFMEALNKYDADGIVLDWLDSKEDYPRVLKALMTDKEALKSVFSHRDNAERLIALDRLRNSLKPRVTLPKLGKLTKTTKSPTGPKDINYWNEYLKNHPRGR